MSVSLSPSLPLSAVPADWGRYDCQRLATATEMAEVGGHCVECGALLAAKVGGGSVAGTMLGYRAATAAPWGWQGPYCRKCEIAHSVADGYGS